MGGFLILAIAFHGIVFKKQTIERNQPRNQIKNSHFTVHRPVHQSGHQPLKIVFYVRTKPRTILMRTSKQSFRW